jgi:uncharacterized repeat protein (TIGR01451 family)
MKNNYFKIRPWSVLERDKSIGRVLLLLSVLMLFAHFSTFAQACDPKLAMTITTVDATSETANNAKIRLSGLPSNALKVGYSSGPTYTGPDFATATAWSSLDSGYVTKTLPTPGSAPGAEYTVRVYNATGSCFTDSTFYLPYVNWTFTPEFVDIVATITRNPGGDVPMGSDVAVYVAVKNDGSKDATGVEFTINYAAGLTFVSDSAATGTTYSDASKKWIIGNLPAGTTILLKMVYTVTTRGIKELTAYNTALNEIDLDSSPSTSSVVEDDQGQLCISTHLDYCDGDEYTFELADSGANYTGVTWQKSNDNGLTFTDITGSTAEYEITASNHLIIKAPGDYKYKRDAGSGYCPFEGCCPVKVIPGLPPILTKPTDVVICFGAPDTTISSANTQLGYTATSNDTYGIVPELPAFLSDQGVFSYQWLNNNGLSNPTTDSIAGQTTLTLTSLPKAVGTYNYKLISVQDGHTSCNDTTEVTYIVNELPIPVATINTPVCQEDTIYLSATNTAVNPTPGITWSWEGPASYTHADSSDRILNAQPVNAGQYIVTAGYTLNGLGCSNTDTVTLVVNLLPAAPVAQDTTYCQLIEAKRLTAQGSADSLRWYKSPTYLFTDKPDTTTIIGYNVGPLPNTNVTAGTTRYFVTQVDGNGCQSHPDTLDVTIDEKPVLPTVQDIAYCEGYPSNPLTATTLPGGYGLIWYGLDKTDRDTSATYTAPPTDVIGTFSYYVSQYNLASNCQSDSAKLDVYIKDTPDAPAVTEPVYCLNATPVDTLLAVRSVPTNALTYYFNGTGSSVSPTPSTAMAGATWYYVTQTTKYDTLLCESAQQPLKVLVNPLPVATIIPVSALCIGTNTQDNGYLILNRFRDSDQVSWNIGSTYNDITGSPASTAFAPIPTSGIFTPQNLANPSAAGQDYTARVRNSFGCTIDVTATLTFKDCTCPGGYCEPAQVTKTK